MARATSPVERKKRRRRTDDDAAGPAPAPAAPETDRQPSDAALLHAAQGDPLAFAPLYQRYATPVFRYCFRQTTDPEIAADLTAQIFTKALEALPRFRIRDDPDDDPASGNTVRSWLFAIAHNAIVDARRRERPTRSLDAPDETARCYPDLADPGVGPEDLAIHRDELGRLLAMLDRLPGNQRQIVELRIAGLTTAEVAEALGLTRPAVKAAQTRAYSRLRDLLGPPPSNDSRLHPASPPPSVEEPSR